MAKIKHLQLTTGEWAAIQTPLDDRRIGIEVKPDGTRAYKMGNGVDLWANLPSGLGAKTQIATETAVGGILSAPEYVANPRWAGQGTTAQMNALTGMTDRQVWNNTTTMTDWIYYASSASWSDTELDIGDTPEKIINSGAIIVDQASGESRVAGFTRDAGASPFSSIPIEHSDYATGLERGTLEDAVYKVTGFTPILDAHSDQTLLFYSMNRGSAVETNRYVYLGTTISSTSGMIVWDKVDEEYKQLPRVAPDATNYGGYSANVGQTAGTSKPRDYALIQWSGSSVRAIKKSNDAVTNLTTTSIGAYHVFRSVPYNIANSFEDAVVDLVSDDGLYAFVVNGMPYSQYAGAIDMSGATPVYRTATANVANRWTCLSRVANINGSATLCSPQGSGTANTATTQTIDFVEASGNDTTLDIPASPLGVQPIIVLGFSKVMRFPNGSIVWTATDSTLKARMLVQLNSDKTFTVTEPLFTGGTNVTSEYISDPIIVGNKAYMLGSDSSKSSYILCVDSGNLAASTATSYTGTGGASLSSAGLMPVATYDSVTNSLVVLHCYLSTSRTFWDISRISLADYSVTRYATRDVDVFTGNTGIQYSASSGTGTPVYTKLIVDTDGSIYCAPKGTKAMAKVSPSGDVTFFEHTAAAIPDSTFVTDAYMHVDTLGEGLILFAPYYAYFNKTGRLYRLQQKQVAPYYASGKRTTNLPTMPLPKASGRFFLSTNMVGTGDNFYNGPMVFLDNISASHLVLNGEQVI